MTLTETANRNDFSYLKGWDAMPADRSAEKPKTLPYNPIDAAMQSSEHARRTVRGVLESYNSNHDALAEAVQNSMDALEDAKLEGLPGPYLLEITIDLKQNAFSVLDTGIGMTQAQVCEAFAPSATFKDSASIIKKRGDKYPYRGYKAALSDETLVKLPA